MNNEEIIKLVSAFIDSLFYNRVDNYLELFIRIIIQTKIDKIGIHLSQEESEIYTPSMLDDINIFWGYFVLLFGEYGVNPANGWVNPSVLPAIRKALMNSKERLELQKEE